MLNESNIELEPSAYQSFIVAGYPKAKVHSIGGKLVPEDLTQIFTGRYVGELMSEPQPHDFYLTYGEATHGQQGPLTPTPKVEGMSGASVWALAAPASGLWSPEAFMKVVGIQSKYIHSMYLRAADWNPVATTLQKLMRSPATSEKGPAS